MLLSVEDIPRWLFVFFSDVLPVMMMAAPTVLLLSLICIPMVFADLLSRCTRCMKEDSIEKAKDFRKKHSKAVLKLAHFSVRGVFRMKPTKRDMSELPETEFFGYVVPHRYVIQAFVMAWLLAGYAAYVFTNIFFVKESYECVAENSDLACFLANVSNMTEKVNCSTISSTFNGTVPDLKCYEFVFQTSEAISAAGGILTMGGVAFLCIVTFILFLSRGKEGWKSKARRRCTFCMQLLMFLSLTSMFSIVPFLDVVHDALEDKNKYVEMLALFVIVGFALYVPWWRFETPREASSNEARGNYQSINH